MTELIKYDAACRMLAEAVAVDEVQGIRNKAEAMRAYARQAKDRDLEISAAQIRFRAERRLGELIIAQRETVGLNAGSRGQLKGRDAASGSAVTEQPEDQRPTLEQAGIDRKLSSRAQRMAAIEPARFEQLLELHREEVLEGNNKVSVDLMRTSAEAEGREKRRQLATVLSDASAEMPTGRKFPVVYADPSWHRNQGVTNRSYENHYPTMSWDEICALPVKDLLLPDAWVFLWIPRAHLLALHAVDMEFADDDGRVITRRVKLPLAWAVARAWGCDDYSTCYIWTKTDEEHPNDQGGGVLVFDQDEILLQFKRGRGLPKPATDEKFKSNHRERKREHSRKPDHYREMIATMAGGVPVLELFARVDAEHPLPPGWHAWGNQAVATPSGVVDSAPNAQCEALSPGAQEDSGRIVGTAGEFAIDDRGALIPRDFLTEAETVSLAEHEALPIVPAPAAPSLSEFDALKAISDFCYPNRAATVPSIVADYIARGLAFKFGARDDWSLSEAGWTRLRALEAERRAAAPPPAPKVSAADDDLDIPSCLDRRNPRDLPLFLAARSHEATPPATAPVATDATTLFRKHLDEDQFSQWSGLTAVAAGEPIDNEVARHLIGFAYVDAHDDGTLWLTDGGTQWLARIENYVARCDGIERGEPVKLLPPPAQIDLEELIKEAS